MNNNNMEIPLNIGELVFYEIINDVALQYITLNPSEYEDQIKKCVAQMRNKDKNYNVWAVLKKNLKSCIKPPELQGTEYSYLKVTYKKGTNTNNKGRWYANKGIGLQVIPNCIRSTICNDLWIDYDQSNSHPTILRSLMEKHRFDSALLNEDVDDRENFLKKVNKDRDTAKNQVIATINGAKYNHKILKSLQEQIKPFIEYLLTHQDYKDDIEFVMKEHPNDENINGKFISRVLQNIENDILESHVNFLYQKGLINTVQIDGVNGLEIALIFDGQQLRVNSGVTSEVIDECRKYALEKTGHDIPIKIKPFENSLELPDDYAEIVKKHNESSQSLSLNVPQNNMRRDIIYANNVLKHFDGKLFLVYENLVVYDEDTGMWSLGDKILRKCCLKYSNELFPNLFVGDEYKTFDSLFNPVLKNILSLAPVDNEFFNNDTQIGYLLFKNGILDMKNFKLLPFDPKYRFTKRINRDFDVSRDYTNGYKQIFDRLYNKQFTDTVKRDYFLQLLSRGIAGHYKERVFGTMIGETSCGKGKQTNLLKNTFEGYISFFNGEELLVKSNSNPDVSRGLSFILSIYDTRLSISNELDIKPQNGGKTIIGLNCNLIKKLVGADTFPVRQIYMKQMDVCNKSRPFFLLNDVPSTHGVDEAFIKRSNYIEYDRSSKEGIESDDDIFFKQDDSIDDFVQDEYIVDSYIYLICKHYEQSCTNILPKPACVIATTNERTGFNDANSYFTDNYSVCDKDSVKKYIKQEKNDKGVWIVDWKKIEEDSFDYYKKLDDIYTDYINSGNSCTKSELTKKIRKQFPHIVVAKKKLYGKDQTMYVGIKTKCTEDSDSDTDN